MRLRLVLLAISLLMATLVGCPSTREEGLIVNLQTDLRAGVEFDEVVLTVDGGMRQSFAMSTRDLFGRPRYLATFPMLGAGRRNLRVALRRAGAERVARTLSINFAGSYLATAVITRNCVDFPCDLGSSCSGMRCIPDDCVTGTEPSCPMSLCSDARPCTTSTSCAHPLCTTGVCIEEPDDSLCRAGEICVIGRGCIPRPEEVDAGPPPDAFSGVDVGVGIDAFMELPDAFIAPDAAVLTCVTPLANCNADDRDGCEVNLTTDPANCGACGRVGVESCNGVDDNCNGAVDEGCRIPVHRAVRSVPVLAYRYTTNIAELSTDGYTPDRMNVYYVYPVDTAGYEGWYNCQFSTGGTLHTRSPTCEEHPEAGTITLIGRVVPPDAPSGGCSVLTDQWRINPGVAPSFFHSFGDVPIETGWMPGSGGPHTACAWDTAGP